MYFYFFYFLLGLTIESGDTRLDKLTTFTLKTWDGAASWSAGVIKSHLPQYSSCSSCSEGGEIKQKQIVEEREMMGKQEEEVGQSWWWDRGAGGEGNTSLVLVCTRVPLHGVHVQTNGEGNTSWCWWFWRQYKSCTSLAGEGNTSQPLIRPE